MPETHQHLSLFHPLIQKWFIQKYKQPTDIQNRSWPEIAKSHHVLITAPTGSGKTLTAFMWAINKLVTNEWEKGRLNVLYISPLKALNNDIQKNLLSPLAELNEFFKNNNAEFPEIHVLTRSGDTPEEERVKMLKNPPEILITTPESLNILLTSKNYRKILTNIKTLVIDEIHSIANTKRGTYLMTAVERVALLADEFQRIVISATIRPLEKIATFAGGYKIIGDLKKCTYEKRNMSIIKSDASKKYDIKVNYPDNIDSTITDDVIWLSLVKEFKKIIHANKSTLLFANSRRTVEKITRFINEDEETELAYSHHGSLSKEIRLTVEEKLKQGQLKAIVATNSLELGIDIGHLDKVILIQTPFAISQAIQRIGRAGHNVGETSAGFIYPVFGKDFINAAVCANSVMQQEIEEIVPQENPLDVLAQVILSMTIPEVWDIDELYHFIKSCSAYHNLTRNQFDLVIDMLAGKYADSRIRELTPKVSVDKLENTIKAKQGMAYLLYMSGGTIPDRGNFNLRIAETKAKIGELDEEFVWERSLGDSFIIGNQVWQIVRITHNDVEVIPYKGPINIIPFWRAEAQNRDFFFSEKIANFLEVMSNKLDENNILDILQNDYFLEKNTASKLIEYLKTQKQFTGNELPHRHHILVEHFIDQSNKTDNKHVVLHTFWGGKINRPFAFSLSAAWEEKYGYPLQYFVDNDSILFMLPHNFSSHEILTLLSGKNIEDLLRKKLESTGYFGARFRENAGIALLLPKMNFKKRMPLWVNRLRAKKLFDAVSKYTDFPILLETWRTCLNDDFDVPTLKMLLDEIHTGQIKITDVSTDMPSPFSKSLLWYETNKYMYEDDTPSPDKKSELSKELLKDILYSSKLRPDIPQVIIKELDEKLKRTKNGYTCDSAQDLLDFVKDRLLIPQEEWKQLLDAIKQEHQIDLVNEITDKICIIALPHSNIEAYCAIENIIIILKAFSIELDDLTVKSLDRKVAVTSIKNSIKKLLKKETTGEEKNYLYTFFEQWLSYYCPITIEFISKLLGLEREFLLNIIEKMVEDEQIVFDKITKNTNTEEVCFLENLEILLRMSRKARQPIFKPLPLTKLQLFLAAFQKVVPKGTTIDDVQSIFEQLFGYPLKASMWEEYIFPARMQTYFTSWLDSLMQSSALTWIGVKGKKIFPAFLDDLKLFLDPSREIEKRELLTQLFPDKNAKYDFFDITNHAKLSSQETSKILWDLTWNSLITNDSFETMRKGILSDFTSEKMTETKSPRSRSGFNRWKAARPISGNWFIVKQQTQDIDFIEANELIKDRIRQLFKRYGILFRELLENELNLIQWSKIIKALRLMELSGEVLSGYFFEDIPGLQFISYDAYTMLEHGLDEDQIYWINAVDPCSLCGIQIESLKADMPQRNNSTIIVFHGSKKVLVSKSNCKNIEIFVEPDHVHLQKYFAFFKDILTRPFNSVTKIFIEKINNQKASTSPYADAFKQFGFRSTYKGLEMWKY